MVGRNLSLVLRHADVHGSLIRQSQYDRALDWDPTRLVAMGVSCRAIGHEMLGKMLNCAVQKPQLTSPGVSLGSGRYLQDSSSSLHSPTTQLVHAGNREVERLVKHEAGEDKSTGRTRRCSSTTA